MAAPGLGCAEEAASRARGGGRGGPGITWAEAGPGAPGGLSPESGRRRWRRQRRCLLTLPPSLPFPPGSGLPARRVSGSQVSAPTCAPSARPATFPATETSQLGAPAPPRRCSQRPGSVLRPRPLSLQPRLEAGAPRVLGFPDPRRSSSSARPAGTLASERRRRQNWESRADGLGTSPRPGARSPPAGSKV